METIKRGRRVRQPSETRRQPDRWWEKVKAKAPGLASELANQVGSKQRAQEAHEESRRQQALRIQQERDRRARETEELETQAQRGEDLAAQAQRHTQEQHEALAQNQSRVAAAMAAVSEGPGGDVPNDAAGAPATPAGEAEGGPPGAGPTDGPPTPTNDGGAS